MQQTIWGWLIAIYLFLGGLGAGAFVAAVLSYKGYFGDLDKKFYKFGFFLAPVSVIIGTLLLVFDLAPSAAINPFKILQLYTRPISMMSIGTYLLTFFIIVSLYVYLLQRNNKKISDGLLITGSIFAVGVMGYTGLLLYVVKAIPLWASIWIPILFVISAMSTGISANATALIKNGNTLNSKINNLHLVLILFEIIAVIGLFASICTTEAGTASASKILMGSLAPAFWLGFIILGLFLPLVESSKIAIGAKNTNENIEIKSSIFNEIGILIGGLCLRIFIIFGAFYII